MPLFFLIAIGAGAMAVGATTVDVTTDAHAKERAAAHAQMNQVQAQRADFNANAFSSHADCLNAAYQQNLPASVCPQS